MHTSKLTDWSIAYLIPLVNQRIAQKAGFLYPFDALNGQEGLDMVKANGQRKGCKDVFNAFLVAVARYAGLFEFPVIEPSNWIPNRLIAFSKAIACKEHDQWIHFYEDDYLFERVWRNPERYLDLFKRYNGVILPDFSLYRDMPFVMQLWNIYRSRAIGCWLQRNGIKVIVNIRYGDRRTYKVCCEGVPTHSTIAIGTHGTLKNRIDRDVFLAGLKVILDTLKPTAIVIYGSAPSYIRDCCHASGTQVYHFESDYAASHKGVE